MSGSGYQPLEKKKGDGKSFSKNPFVSPLRLDILLYAMIMWFIYFSAQLLVAYEIACSVQSEGDYLASAVLHNDTPSKLWMSAAAADEIDDLQHYTWLLAHHDLAVSIASGSSQAPFAEAAFDLASSPLTLCKVGCRTWWPSFRLRSSMLLNLFLRCLSPGDIGCTCAPQHRLSLLRSCANPSHSPASFRKQVLQYGSLLHCAVVCRREAVLEVMTRAITARIPRQAPPPHLHRKKGPVQR